MRKILMIAVLMVAGLFAIALATANANPFLVCDPVAEEITEYVVIQDGVEYISTPLDLGDGTVTLHYDLGGLSIGEHHFEVAARNDWGTSEYASWDCTKAVPGVPSGLRLLK